MLSKSEVFFCRAYNETERLAAKAASPSVTRSAVVAANVARYAAAPMEKCSKV